jgi:hypothetical protein
MAVIYKYPIHIGTDCIVRNGNVVHFAKDQYGQLSVWVQHFDNDVSQTKLYIVGTGQTFRDEQLFTVHSLMSTEWSGILWRIGNEDQV